MRFAAGNYDSVLVSGYASAASWAAIVAARSQKLPIIMWGDTQIQRKAASVKAKVKNWILPAILRGVSGVVAVGTRNMAYWLSQGVPAESIRMSLFSVDNQHFSVGSQRLAPAALVLREKWGAQAGDVVFLYCAKLTTAKGPDLLLEAFSQLGNPRAHLVYVGSGPLEGSLRRRHAAIGTRHVHWEGFVNQSRLPAYYRAADLLVLPSRFEPWGLVVNEAMACGRGCIVSDAAGSGVDLIAGRDAGVTFKSGDLSALIAAMRLGLDPANRCRWSEKAGAAVQVASLERTVACIKELAGRAQTRCVSAP